MTDFSERELKLGAGSKLTVPPEFGGPTSKRRVTDPFFSFLLIVAWGCFLYVGVWSYKNGNAEYLFHPSDYKGRLCGYDVDESGVVLPSKWAPTDYLANGVCVETCSNWTNLNPYDISELVCKDDDDIMSMEGCTSLSEGYLPESIEILIACGACLYQLESVDALDYCIPNPGNVSTVIEKIDSAATSLGLEPFGEQYTQRYIPIFEQLASDIWTARKIVLGVGVGGSALLGFIFLILLRVPGLVACTIWMSVLLLPILMGLGGYYCMVVAANHSNDTLALQFWDISQTLTYTSYALYGVTACIVLALCILRTRLYLAIAITKAAGRSIVAVPMSLGYPIIQLCGYLSFLLPWLGVLALLASTGEPTETSTDVFNFPIKYTTYKYTKEAFYGFWYLIFIHLWTSQFIIAMGQITLAICFSKWYFTVNKDGGIRTTVLGAICVGLWNHTGTAALGSLIVAIVQFIRSLLVYAKRKVKEAGMQNTCTNMLFCCCQCILGIIERCIQYLNKNAYIQTALFGYPLCKASREAFFLIARHAFRMTAIGLVSTISLVFCRLFIVVGVSLVAFYAMEELYAPEMFSILSMVLLVAVISWYVASMFTGVLSISVSTILQCFLIDEEMFGDQGGSKFVPSELQDFLKQLDDDDKKRTDTSKES